jgi:hypothetical protein
MNLQSLLQEMKKELIPGDNLELRVFSDFVDISWKGDTSELIIVDFYEGVSAGVSSGSIDNADLQVLAKIASIAEQNQNILFDLLDCEQLPDLPEIIENRKVVNCV